MTCEVCGKKEATVLYTHIADNEKKSVHMCGDCVAAYKVKLRSGAGKRAAAASKAVAKEPPKGKRKEPQKGKRKAPPKETPKETAAAPDSRPCCRHCGVSYDDFRKRGRFGCHLCYDSFRSELERLLKRIHGSLDHCGKGLVPRQEPRQVGSELEDLNQALAQAVTTEAYEQAAELRDRIRVLSAGADSDADDSPHAGSNSS